MFISQGFPSQRLPWRVRVAIVAVLAGLGLALSTTSCGSGKQVSASNAAGAIGEPVSVAVAPAVRKTLEQHLTLSSELVPYQEIDVFAKESGFVKKLNVDYGSHVKAGDILAVLEIPELEAQLQQDDAAIKAADQQVERLQKLVASVDARRRVQQEYADNLTAVSKQKVGLVAKQEVDDALGKALTGQADVDAANANVEAARSNADAARAKRIRDAVMYDYRNVKAEFDGVVTERYANFGTLIQAGTSSSTQAMPLVRLSEDDQFRLVIPVEESYVRYIHVNDPVNVEVPSLGRNFPGKIARFSEEVAQDTRTMHTEVQVINDASRDLKPGMYANATIQLQKKSGAVAIPLRALDRQGDRVTVDVVNASNQVEARAVTTGIETSEDVEIVSGVKAGEMVVVGDRSGLKAGQTVAPKPADVTGYKEQ